MAQISASVHPDLIKSIKDIQDKEKIHSFSQAVETLLQDAVATRIKKNKTKTTV